MPRPRTGTYYRHGDHFDCKVTLQNGKRSPPIHMHGVTTEEAAAKYTKLYAEAAARGELVLEAPPTTTTTTGEGETLSRWGVRWFAARARRGLDVYADEKRFAKWVEAFRVDGGTLGALPMTAITTDIVEGFVEFIDSKVLEGVLSWKTAINIWGLVTKALDDATRAKDRDLRVLKTNPAASVRGPDRGAEKAKAGFYPDEIAAILAAEGVPLHHRRAIALMVYLYPRPSELSALRWEDVDLEHGFVTFHRGRRKRGAQDGTTKTAEPRDVPIEAELVPLLAAMKHESGGTGRVCPLPDERHLSRWLHVAMQRAGVARAALLESSSTRRRARFYDCRATGISWRLARGDNPIEVKVEAGHDTFATTEKYLRGAMLMRGKIGPVFGPLPAAIVSAKRPGHPQVPGFMVEAQGIESRASVDSPRVSGRSYRSEASKRRFDRRENNGPDDSRTIRTRRSLALLTGAGWPLWGAP